jgi:hypothetical protein
MSINPIFAEDISPAILIVFLAPLFLALLALISLRRTRATRSSSLGVRSEIARRLIPVIGGAFFLFFFLTVRGGAPAFFYEIAAIPLVVGLLSLYVLGQKRPEAARPVAVTFRVLLYGFFALVFIGLCAKLLMK